MLQNIHPRIKAHLLFASKPEYVQDLFSLAATVAEAVAVEEQRNLLTTDTQKERAPGSTAKSMVVAAASGRGVRCWECGDSGHIRRTCPEARGSSVSGNPTGVRE
jgi:cell division protein FtsI/penicillin-binding protein 2